MVAIVVHALITIFLFREGFGFFDENLRLRASAQTFRFTSSTVAGQKLAGLLNRSARLTNPAVIKQFLSWKDKVRSFFSTLAIAYQRLEPWDPSQPVSRRAYPDGEIRLHDRDVTLA